MKDTTETGLVRYDAMKTAISAAREVDEVKDIRDKSIALETYARQAHDHEAEEKCREIRLRAERQCGKLLRKTEKDKGGRPTKTGPASGPVSKSKPKTLAKFGISKNQSSQWQQLGEVPDDEFEQILKEEKQLCNKPTTQDVIVQHKRRNGEPDYGKPESFYEDGMDEKFIHNNTYVLSLWGWVEDFLEEVQQYDPAELARCQDHVTGPSLKKNLPAAIEYLKAIQEAFNEYAGPVYGDDRESHQRVERL